MLRMSTMSLSNTFRFRAICYIYTRSEMAPEQVELSLTLLLSDSSLERRQSAVLLKLRQK